MNFNINELLAEQAPELCMDEFDQLLLADLKVAYPNEPVRHVRRTEIPNVFAVIIGTTVSYLLLKPVDLANVGQPGGAKERYRYLIQGGTLLARDLSKDYAFADLTKNLSRVARLIDVSQLPLENAICDVRGKGERELYVFMDPNDAPCRNLYKVLQKIDNIKIWYFFLPANLSPAHVAVCEAMYTNDNCIAILDRQAKGEKLEIKPAQKPTPVPKNIELCKQLHMRQCPTYFFETGERGTGVVSAELLEQKLKEIEKIKNMSIDDLDVVAKMINGL